MRRTGNSTHLHTYKEKTVGTTVEAAESIVPERADKHKSLFSDRDLRFGEFAASFQKGRRRKAAFV